MDHSVLGSILGSRYSGKLPYCFMFESLFMKSFASDIAADTVHLEAWKV